MTSYYSNSYTNDEYEFDDDHEEDEDVEASESDEDTEEASETEFRKTDSFYEYRDIRDQIYLGKISNLKDQLQQLNDGVLPEYCRKARKLEQQFRDRLRSNENWRDYQIEIVEKDFIAEKRAASKELEEKMVDLKENIIQDLEEKRRIIETERVTMELSGDSTEAKPAVTRKLRRRPNDPIPIPEKRRGKLASLPCQLQFQLDDKEIETDIKAIMRGIKTNSSVRKPGPMPSNGVQPIVPLGMESPASETRIEDGKLLYERRWFHRGQPVYVEGKDLQKFPAIISSIGSEAIWVKKTSDASKVRIYIAQLVRGKVSIKRRAS